jgi:hypothetical protein
MSVTPWGVGAVFIDPYKGPGGSGGPGVSGRSVPPGRNNEFFPDVSFSNTWRLEVDDLPGVGMDLAPKEYVEIGLPEAMAWHSIWTSTASSLIARSLVASSE